MKAGRALRVVARWRKKAEAKTGEDREELDDEKKGRRRRHFKQGKKENRERSGEL